MKISKPIQATPRSGGGDMPPPLRAGIYSAEVKALELKETKSGGQALVASLHIADHNRTVMDWINVRNQNPEAVRIGMEILNDFILSCGLTEIKADTDELVGKTCQIRLAVDGTYNAVKRYLYQAQPQSAEAFGDAMPNDEVPL